MLSYEHTTFVCFILFKRKILHECMHIKFFPSISTRGFCYAKGRKKKLIFLSRLYLIFFIVITAGTLIFIEIREIYLLSR